MSLRETAAPLEIVWAGIFTAAAVNFGLELRQCLDDSRNLARQVEAGGLTKDEAYSRRIYVTGAIWVQMCNMLACIAFAGAGYFLMFMPNGNPPTVYAEQSYTAIVVSSLMILAGITMVICSFLVRAFTKRLRHTLVYRKRQSDRGQNDEGE